jgi:hypothetical protein
MATRRYGLSRGETEFNVTEGVGAATNADDVEVTVDLAKSLSKAEVLDKLDEIKNWIVKGNWPPA